MTTEHRTLLQRDDHSVRAAVDAYTRLHDERAGGDLDARKANYEVLINRYYDLVTDFYEFGWGTSFHFAPARADERFEDAILRHEVHLADALGLASGMTALDVGCGVGGPMRNIARYSGAEIVGINNNAYQIERGRRHSVREQMEHRTRFVKADFMAMPFDDGAFDGVYTIEASCHAPDKAALFTEIARVMKPGATFAGYEWCLTDAFSATNAEHQRIKKGIEEGDGLPDIAHTSEVDAALEMAGFEVLEARDMAPEAHPDRPWYLPLSGRDRSLRGLPRTPVGRKLTNAATRVMERLKIAPEGTARVSDFLNVAADALVAGGETGVFTPMYFFRARKPASD
ncbi:MAG: methyltransferase domain-containing protein [Myxococcota bacterium]